MHLPSSFIRSLQGLPGYHESEFIKAHESQEQVTSIRINAAKQNMGKPANDSMNDGTGNNELTTVDCQLPANSSSIVPWCCTGFYLPQRPAFTLDPLFHAGAYYVQEASSMFLEQVLQQTTDLSHPLKVLDVCAAPGGKSTHLQSLLSKDSLLVSNEVIKARASVLTENITKWGAANVVVTNNDPWHFGRLPDFFDVLVVDAPCSGSGLFRKDLNAIDEWSEDAVQLCSQRQQRILTDVLPCLQPGGLLIYSTCSYSVAEDEDILQWLVRTFEMESIRLKISPDWGIVETIIPDAYGYRFYPDKLKGEGFFIAVLRKPGVREQASLFPALSKQNDIGKKAAALLQTWLKEEMSFTPEKDDWLAMPAPVAAYLPGLKKHLYLRKAGINMGRLIRNELVPHHELALSPLISQNGIETEVTKEQALQYLRRQDVTIETSLNGWSLVTFRGYHLGWMKQIGSRTNNYYPMEWRIRK